MRRFPGDKSSPQRNDDPSLLSKLTSVAFGLAIAVVIARATSVEILRDREIPIPESAAVPRSAGPATGLILDLVLILPALVLLWRSTIDPEFRLRKSQAIALFSLLAAFAVASACWASDRFASIAASFHLIAAGVLMWSMAQFVRRWEDLRLIVGACFGILLILVAQGFIVKLIDQPADLKVWQETKIEQLARNGLEPGTFAAEQFEKKVLSGEVFGFNVSPNTYAALLVMLGIVAAGAIVQRISDRDEPGWAFAIFLAVGLSFYPIYYTFSKTALITPILGAAVLFAWPRLGVSRRMQLYIAGLALFAFGCIALIGHGLYHGSLVARSMTFRWYYWVGAAKVFFQHPLLGTGWANFGAYYLGTRLPIATEEIKDPHNLIVRAAAELGFPGLLLMIGWLARSAWEFTSPGFAIKEPVESTETTNSSPGKIIFALSGAAVLLNVLVSVDLLLDSPDAAWFIIAELFKRMLFFVLLLLGFAATTLRSSREPILDGRRAPWIVAGILAAITVFFVHNLIDFSFFETGPMFVFAMLVGALIGVRGSALENAQTGRMKLPLAIAATTVFIAAAAGVVAPMVAAEISAQSAKDDVRHRRVAIGAEKLWSTFNSLWIPNGDYAYTAAIISDMSGEPVEKVRSMLDAARQANPMSAEYARNSAEFELRHDHPDQTRVVAGYEQTLKLDPANVTVHTKFADALTMMNQPQRAVVEYEQALRYDAMLPADEPKRLTPAQRAEIEQKMQSLKQ